jgi:hypothetical protein
MFQSQRIDEVVGPSLINPSYTCSINAFIEILLHMLPPRLMIFACPNRDPTVYRVRLLSVAMFQHQLVDVSSVSVLCESGVLGAKGHSEFAPQILGHSVTRLQEVLVCSSTAHCTGIQR